MNIVELKHFAIDLQDFANDNGIEFNKKITDKIYSIELEYQQYYNVDENNWEVCNEHRR
tara:strand:- start:574 stop:750 length:177 start_codon:yes stop_codon:yes gene_type:complete